MGNENGSVPVMDALVEMRRLLLIIEYFGIIILLSKLLTTISTYLYDYSWFSYA